MTLIRKRIPSRTADVYEVLGIRGWFVFPFGTGNLHLKKESPPV